MAMERLPGIGNGSSDQFLPWAGGRCCGGGIARLGNGGSLFADAGGSNVLLMGVCNVGMRGALLYGPGANPCDCLFIGGSSLWSVLRLRCTIGPSSGTWPVGDTAAEVACAGKDGVLANAKGFGEYMFDVRGEVCKAVGGDAIYFCETPSEVVGGPVGLLFPDIAILDARWK